MALLRLALMGIVLAPACLPMPGPLHAGEFDPDGPETPTRAETR